MKRLIFVAIGIVLLTGCGTKRSSGGTVTGKITYNGKPVNGALLRLIPSSKEGEEFRIPVTQEGTYNSSGVPAGDYKIVVQGTEVPPDVQKTMKQMPKGMDPAKAEEMKQKFQQAHQETPTIPFPAKYKKPDTTDLKWTITQGKQELNLDLKD